MSRADASPGGSFEPVTVTGAVDGLTGLVLNGWAFDPAHPDTACSILVIDEAGQVVAQGPADLPRPDLAEYGFGRIACGFRLPIGTLGASPWLRVYADGAELSASPLATGPGQFDGAVSVHDGWAEGWVQERVHAAEPPTVRLLDQDDICIGWGDSLASTPSGDPTKSFAPARFRIALLPHAWRHAELGLRATVQAFPRAPAGDLVEGREGDKVFACAEADLSLLGFVDAVDARHCRGWLTCPSAASVRFDIDVYRDGAWVGAGTADLPRGDLREAYPDNWSNGFAIDLLPPLTGDDGRAAIVSLRLAGTDTELLGSPFLVGGAHGMAIAAQHAATRALAAPGLGAVGRAVLQAALADFLTQLRQSETEPVRRASGPAAPASSRRLTVVIPVYRDVELTRACIDSVLTHSDTASHAIVLINDASPDPDMPDLLDCYRTLPGVHVLTNPINLGFVQTVNRALRFCQAGDVLLLNSDTRVFAGGLHELWSVAHADRAIGSVTALSNNATIFSYPVGDQGCDALDDIGWEALAAATLHANRGRAVDVPTGHGFCLLLTRAALDRVGAFDEGFGRGYGEENDWCLRAADLGFRHVAAAGAFVEHRESVSFGPDKAALLQRNLAILEARYPEYAESVRACLRRDDLRVARWGIDAHRLARARDRGARFVLVLRNWLDGGTRQAITDIEHEIGYGGAEKLDACVGIDGTIRVTCAMPRLGAVFASGEHAALFALADAADASIVLVHQLLGYTTAFVHALHAWGVGREMHWYVHDYYSACPRVTMIDAIGRFCDVAPVAVCTGCVALGGAHDASRMTELTPQQHRALFEAVLGGMRRIIAPSSSAAVYLARAFPAVTIDVVPHPEPRSKYTSSPATGATRHIALLGAIGAHKGSAKLLEIARLARMVASHLQFHVIGYTDIDAELMRTGNVTVSGFYHPTELAGLVAASQAGIALFLHGWPETFSYTLSEAVRLGLVPLVPDIGAPADRVRAAGFGHVFGFPISAAAVVDLLVALDAGSIALLSGGASPAGFAQVLQA